MNISAGRIENSSGEMQMLGLPFGAKSRLLLSKIQTEASRNQSPVIPIQTSMTGMLKELGFKVTGGKLGTIASFKEQTSRLAACRFQAIYAQSNENRDLQSVIPVHTAPQRRELFRDFGPCCSLISGQKEGFGFLVVPQNTTKTRLPWQENQNLCGRSNNSFCYICKAVSSN